VLGVLGEHGGESAWDNVAKLGIQACLARLEQSKHLELENDGKWNSVGSNCADSPAKPGRGDWPRPVLPQGTVCLRVLSSCGA